MEEKIHRGEGAVPDPIQPVQPKSTEQESTQPLQIELIQTPAQSESMQSVQVEPVRQEPSQPESKAHSVQEGATKHRYSSGFLGLDLFRFLPHRHQVDLGIRRARADRNKQKKRN